MITVILFSDHTASIFNEGVQLMSGSTRLDVQQQWIRGEHFKTQWSGAGMETSS